MEFGCRDVGSHKSYHIITRPPITIRDGRAYLYGSPFFKFKKKNFEISWNCREHLIHHLTTL